MQYRSHIGNRLRPKLPSDILEVLANCTDYFHRVFQFVEFLQCDGFNLSRPGFRRTRRVTHARYVQKGVRVHTFKGFKDPRPASQSVDDVTICRSGPPQGWVPQVIQSRLQQCWPGGSMWLASIGLFNSESKGVEKPKMRRARRDSQT